MSYVNPQVPHEVNVSKTSDVRTFFHLSACIGLTVGICFILIYFSFKWFSSYIPFSVEQSMMPETIFVNESVNKNEQKAQDSLQTLANQLAKQMNVPKDMPVHIHLMDSPEKNAFATLGGHIVLTQGLIDSVQSENELAMVIGHEIGHVKNRDPIVYAGSSLTFNLMVAVLTGGDLGVVGNATNTLTQLTFSRKQERDADDLALAALKAHYGHTNGADGFFQTILKDEKNHSLVSEFLSTHPDTEGRVKNIQKTQEPNPDFVLTSLSSELIAIKGSKKENLGQSEEGCK